MDKKPKTLVFRKIPFWETLVQNPVPNLLIAKIYQPAPLKGRLFFAKAGCLCL
jgi:hypothetical protein